MYFYFDAGGKDSHETSSMDVNDGAGLFGESTQAQTFKIKTDVEKTEKVLEEMITQYSVYILGRLHQEGLFSKENNHEKNKAIKVFEDIFLSHLMNLFNAGLLQPKKMNECINKFR